MRSHGQSSGLLSLVVICFLAVSSHQNVTKEEESTNKKNMGLGCGRISAEESEKGRRPWMALLQIESEDQKTVKT